LAQSILTGINTCDEHFDTEENINQFLLLLQNIKVLDQNIDQNTPDKTLNVYNTLKATLETKKTTLQQEKKQDQIQETAENKAINILRSAPTLELANQLF